MGEITDQTKGRVKQTAGGLTDDDRLRREGKGDELLGKAKFALSDLRDRAEGAFESAKGKVDDIR